MNYKQFKKEWADAMVYKILDKEWHEEMLNDAYTTYKESCEYHAGLSVLEWCEIQYQDVTLDTHSFMIKSKALETKHGNGLKVMANKYRKNMGLPLIDLIEQH